MKYTLVLLLLVVSVGLKAEITIPKLSNQEMNDAVYTIGKIVFLNDSIYLIGKKGEILGADNVHKVRSIVFLGESSSINDEDDLLPVQVYPNPTSDILNISGIDDATLRVFDMNGSCMLQTHGSIIDVSSLINGSYILQVNTFVVKFIKK